MTSEPPAGDDHARGVALAQSGRHEEALACIQRRLADRADDGDALNDAGTILYALGRFAEAAEHLRRAAEHLGDDKPQALWNLAEVHLAAGKPADAAAMFPDLADAGLLNAELVNRTTQALVEAGELGGAVELLLGWAGKAGLDDELSETILANIRNCRPRVAFIGDGKRLADLADIRRYVARRFPTETLPAGRTGQAGRLLAWCDVAWFEGLSPEFIAASRSRATRKTICRLDCRDEHSPLPEQVQWGNVDVVFTDGEDGEQSVLARRLPAAASATRIVSLPAGVDLERWPPANRKGGKNIACHDELSLAGGAIALLHCFQRLHAADPEFRLFFSGELADEMLADRLIEAVERMALSGAVVFDGWQEDLAAWLADKDFIASAAVGDSVPPHILAAMAMGLQPVVAASPGRQRQLGEEHVFATTDDFCRCAKRQPRKPEKCRSLVAERFPLSKTTARVGEVLAEFEKEISPRGGASWMSKVETLTAPPAAATAVEATA